MVRLVMINLLNACKVTTLAALAACAYHYGFQTMRAYIYFATHVTYLVWWFAHQRISPNWGKSVFGEGDLPVAGIITLFLIIGPGYALPGYFAFKSTSEPHPWVLVASIMLYTLGSLINAAGDWYKDGAKSIQPSAVVMTGPFSLSRHISWFGDWLRYGSYALMSGTPMGLFPLAWTMFFNLGAVQQRSSGQASRGGEAYKKWAANTPAVIPWRLLL
jgi:protein-S-isoprenylcysteine O-methyltransferase Ste14